MPTRPLAVAVVAALVAWAGLCAPASAQEKVYLRRFADSVGVRIGEHGNERMLYYFSPTAWLAVGDEMEQEGGAHSEVLLSAGGRVELTGPAHLAVDALDEAGDVLTFSTLSRLAIVAGDRMLTLNLPGGIVCEMQETRIDMHVELGRLRIRNTGALPVTIRGLVQTEGAGARHGQDEGEGGGGGARGARAFEIGRGEEVRVPNFSGLEAAPGPRRTGWNGTALWHDARVAVSAEGATVRVDATEAEAELSLAGVATRIAAGRGLIVHDRTGRRPVDRAPAPLAAPAPPAPVEPAASDEPETPTDAPEPDDSEPETPEPAAPDGGDDHGSGGR